MLELKTCEELPDLVLEVVGEVLVGMVVGLVLEALVVREMWTGVIVDVAVEGFVRCLIEGVEMLFKGKYLVLLEVEEVVEKKLLVGE